MSQTTIFPLTHQRFIMVYDTADLNVNFDEVVSRYVMAWEQWQNTRVDKLPVTNNSKSATLLRIVVHVVRDLVQRDLGGGRADAHIAAKEHLDHLKKCDDYAFLVDQVSVMALRIFVSLPDDTAHVSYVASPHDCLYIYAGDLILEHTHYPYPGGGTHAQST